MSYTSQRAKVLRAVQFGTKIASGWIRASCPFCAGSGGGARDNFGYNPQTTQYYCFKCQISGNLGGSGQSPYRPYIEETVKAHLLGEERPTMEVPPGYVSLSSPEEYRKYKARGPIEYLRNRKINPSLIEQAKIGYFGVDVPYGDRQRVVIPILDTSEKAWLGWVGRKWEKGHDPRYTYRYNPGFDRRETLYNSHALTVSSDTHPIFIVEGAFDALYLWPHAVAVLGTYSEYQVQLLLQSKRPLVVVLDGDAHDLAMGFALKLDLYGAHVGCIRLPGRKDPDEMTLQWLYEEAYASLEKGVC